MADMGEVLNGGIGVAVALVDDRLALVLVEEDLVLQRAGVLGPDDLHRFLAQALVLAELAGADPGAGETLDFFHLVVLSSEGRLGQISGSRSHRGR